MSTSIVNIVLDDSLVYREMAHTDHAYSVNFKKLAAQLLLIGFKVF